MKFEKRLEEVEKTLKDLGDEDLDLQAAMKLYKSGLAHIKQARKELDEFKLELEQTEL